MTRHTETGEGPTIGLERSPPPVPEAARTASPVTTAPELTQAEKASHSQGKPASSLALLGPYELLERIACGGMGVVYKARHTTLDRIVALKTMRGVDAPDGETTQRFRREAQAAARLNHANIVPIYEVGEHEGQPFYTMAFVSGGTLSQVRDRLDCSQRFRVSLVEKIARAVHYAHEQGVLHRDLKPSNVLLNEQGEPLVSDFGLAKLQDSDVLLTQTGEVLGTPAYMAPEQAAGQNARVGRGTDIWALGVILYELLLGRRPHDGTVREAILHNIITSAPTPPRSLCPNLAPALESIVLKCLEKDPKDRYQSAQELADDLGRWQRGLRLPNLAQRRKPNLHGRRKPIAVAAAGAAAALILAVAFFATRRDSQPESPLDAAITLIGENDAPEKTGWLMGDNVATAIAQGPSQTFALRAKDNALLEVAPTVPWKKYRLSVEIRQEEGEEGAVGIFFGCHQAPSPQGQVRLAGLLTFADWGKLQGKANVRFLGFSEKGAISYHFIGTPHYFSPASIIGAKPWRKLVVDVTADKVTACWEDQCVLDMPRAEILQQLGTIAALNPAFPGQYDPAGGCGLYLEEGLASFRRMTLAPLP